MWKLRQVYIYGTQKTHTNTLNKKKVSSYSFLTLVESNQTNFTRREVAKADDARKLFINLDMPGNEKFFKMLETNMICDCPVTLGDTKRCFIIYGKELAKVKGVTTRVRLDKIQIMKNIPIPKMIIDNHSEEIVSLDFLFVQVIPFLHSISEAYKNRTIDPLRGKKKANNTDITNMSKRVINAYHARGIRISQVNVDNEFEILAEKRAPISVNVAGACLKLRTSF